jgi:ABC-2 type transport system ATP-binding protein
MCLREIQMNDKAIQVRDLEYSYGSNHAVQGVSFTVERGEILGFLGPNGAGKTTTVKILTGLLPPLRGEVTVLGFNLPQAARQMQARIGVSFEKTNLYEQMTAEENLKFYSRLYRVRAFDPGPLLERVGLGGKGRDRVQSYSKGMKQRLMIARTLINTPEILFLDEPTDGLDPVSADTIRRIIIEERDRGAAVFLTTHDMQEADKLSNRVAFINQGKIVAADTPLNLKRSYGERALNIEMVDGEGTLRKEKLNLDSDRSGDEAKRLIDTGNVVSVHSAEATLEDIFIQITGRGLA